LRRSCCLIFLFLPLLFSACAHQTPASPPVKAAAPPPVAKVTPPSGPGPAVKLPPPPLQPARGATLVGVLLPLSGPSATLGNALLNAVQLALFEVASGELTLLPFDSKGTAEGATAAAALARDQHVDILVGPVFAAELRAAAAVVAPAHIPLLSLSADRSVAGQGSYVLGFLPGPQGLAVAEYAASRGKLRQAVLAPANDYGRTLVNDLNNHAGTIGISLAPIEYYDPTALDLTNVLKRLLAAHQGEDPGFDALLLPDDGARLRRVGEQWRSQAVAQGVDPARVTLLGTMIWDDARPGDQPALAGAWYAAAPAGGFVEFAKRYGKAFGATPPRLASLAYDAAALAMVLARANPHDFSVGLLTNPLGFAGIDGLFRLRPDGSIERAYAIKEVLPNSAAKVIQPAPTSFSGS
jgi:ABC-type branched-subunit amino acid transport system substrate-binding protein